MEDAIGCTNRAPFRWAVIAFAVFAALFVFVVVTEAPWSSAAIWGSLAVACAVGAFRTCLDVRLRSDGSIELRYLRRRVQLTAVEIHEIRYTEGEGRSTFAVRYSGGRFRIENDLPARRLIDRMLRLNPTIELTGDAYMPRGG